MKDKLFSPLLVESAEENVRTQFEARKTNLPLWWYPCAFVCFAIPICLLILIITL